MPSGRVSVIGGGGDLPTSTVRKFGHNTDIDTLSVPEDVWDGGGMYPWPALALATTIQSDQAADDAGGTGARCVVVQGLANDLTILQEEVELNGVAPVALANQYFRVFRAYITKAGSTESNVGNITVQHGATVIAQISATFGQTLMALFTIPATFTNPMLLSIFASVSRQLATSCTLTFQYRLLFQADGVTREPNPAWRTQEIFGANSTGSSVFEAILAKPTPLMMGTDFRMRVIECTTNDTGLSAGFTVGYDGASQLADGPLA